MPTVAWPFVRTCGVAHAGHCLGRGQQCQTTCGYRSCSDPATATVLAGATRVNACFTHEREYADRYGAADIYALAPRRSPFEMRRLARALPVADITGHRSPLV